MLVRWNVLTSALNTCWFSLRLCVVGLSMNSIILVVQLRLVSVVRVCSCPLTLRTFRTLLVVPTLFPVNMRCVSVPYEPT